MQRSAANTETEANVLAALLSDVPLYGDAAAQRVIAAALAEFTEYGFRRVSVDDIARRAGMHRVTVYRRFKNKDEVVLATVITWVQAFFQAVAAAVAAPNDPEEGIVEGFALALSTMRSEPLVTRVLANEADYFVPFIVGHGGVAVAVVRETFAHQLRRMLTPEAQEHIDIDGVAELVARAGLSFLLTPQSHFALETTEDIRAFAHRYLAPLLVPRSSGAKSGPKRE